MLEAKIKAEAEYDKFRVIQDKEYISDFDKEVKNLLKIKKRKNKNFLYSNILHAIQKIFFLMYNNDRLLKKGINLIFSKIKEEDN